MYKNFFSSLNFRHREWNPAVWPFPQNLRIFGSLRWEAGKKKVMMKWQNTFSLFRLQPALRYGKVCRFLTENVPTDRMKNKISRQYFRVLPIRCASREDVFASILYDASCPTALLGGNTFSIKLDRSLVPSRPWRFRKWRHLSSLSGKFAEDALGSKTPLVTQIARTGLVRGPGGTPL